MKLVALPEITVITMGQSPPSSSYNSNGEGLPFFQGKTDFGDIYPTARAFCTEPNKIAEPNDILMSVRAPVGSTNLNRVRSCIGRGLAYIRCSSKTDLYYLFYFLRFYESEIINFSRGSTFDSISRDDLDRIRVPLPPIAEQKRIAAICAKADRMRRTRRYALELSDTYLRSVFLEMFGDPVENPKGWEKVRISELGKVETGNTPPREDLENYGNYIEWIKSDNIIDGNLYIDKSKEMLSEKGVISGRTVECGSILIVCIAGSANTIGNVGLANRKVAFNQQINAITPKKGVNSFFLYGLFLFCKPLIQRSTTESMKRIITKSKLEDVLL